MTAFLESDAALIDKITDRWSWEAQSATARIGFCKLIAASSNPKRDPRDEWNRRSIPARRELLWSLVYGPDVDAVTRAAAEEEARVAAEADEATLVIFRRLLELEEAGHG